MAGPSAPASALVLLALAASLALAADAGHGLPGGGGGGGGRMKQAGDYCSRMPGCTACEPLPPPSGGPPMRGGGDDDAHRGRGNGRHLLFGGIGDVINSVLGGGATTPPAGDDSDGDDRTADAAAPEVDMEEEGPEPTAPPPAKDMPPQGANKAAPPAGPAGLAAGSPPMRRGGKRGDKDGRRGDRCKDQQGAATDAAAVVHSLLPLFGGGDASQQKGDGNGCRGRGGSRGAPIKCTACMSPNYTLVDGECGCALGVGIVLPDGSKDGMMWPGRRDGRRGARGDGKAGKDSWGGKDGKGKDGWRGKHARPVCQRCPDGMIASTAAPKTPPPAADQKPPIERGGPGGRRGGPGRRDGKRGRGRLALCMPCENGKKANKEQTECV